MSTMEYLGPTSVDWKILSKAIRDEKKGLLGLLLAVGVNLIFLAVTASFIPTPDLDLIQSGLIGTTFVLVLLCWIKARIELIRAFSCWNLKIIPMFGLIVLLPAIFFATSLVAITIKRIWIQFGRLKVELMGNRFPEWFLNWVGVFLAWSSLMLALLLFFWLIREINSKVQFSILSRQNVVMAWTFAIYILLSLLLFGMAFFSVIGMNEITALSLCGCAILWAGLFQIVLIFQYWQLLRIAELLCTRQIRKQLRAEKLNEHD